MNSDKLTTLLKTLKQANFNKAQATFWIIKRSGKPSTPIYETFYVDTESHLQVKLTDIVHRAIDRANQVKPYDYYTADMAEEDALAVSVTETGFDSIQAQISQGSNAPRITEPKQFNDSWAYLIDLEIGGKHISAVHKITGGWALKKQAMLVKVLFSKSTLVDYEDAPVFQLERKIDFLAFGDVVFILDKSKFESVLNFRVGMERKRDELLKDLSKMDLLSDLGMMRKSIGTNMNLLRRAACVKKNGYYQDVKFMAELKQVCHKHGWNVQWQDGRIIVTTDNVGVILTLLNNDRLQSPVNMELFDVLVKNRIK